MKKLVLNPLKSSIVSSSYNLIQNRGLSSISKIFIMRHAESHFNSEIKKLENAKNTMNESDYEKLKADIRFSKEFIDCEITEKGKNQCLMAGKKLNDFKIDYVFVSPLRRTLMTCEHSIKEIESNKPHVIVYPFIFEKIEDSCDIIGDISRNMRDYPHYDWKFFETVYSKKSYQLDYCDVWPFEFKTSNSNAAEEDSKHKHNILGDDHEQNLDIVLDAMRQLCVKEKYIESSFKTVERLKSFKRYINSFMMEKKNESIEDKNILVIGHSILFKHLTANYLDEETYEPTENSILGNCELAEISFL